MPLYPYDNPQAGAKACKNDNPDARFRDINVEKKPELEGKRCCAGRQCMDWGGWRDIEQEDAKAAEARAATKAEKEAAKVAEKAAKEAEAAAATAAAASALPTASQQRSPLRQPSPRAQPAQRPTRQLTREYELEEPNLMQIFDILSHSSCDPMRLAAARTSAERVAVMKACDNCVFLVNGTFVDSHETSYSVDKEKHDVRWVKIIDVIDAIKRYHEPCEEESLQELLSEYLGDYAAEIEKRVKAAESELDAQYEAAEAAEAAAGGSNAAAVAAGAAVVATQLQ